MSDTSGLDEPLFVSRSVLPSLDDYTDRLRQVWANGLLTNVGPLHRELEAAIARRVGYEHVSLWNNGTSALMGALSALDLHDEVIVTPFTFPATVHAIAMLGLTPVFADIDPVRMTLDPQRVAERVTANTSGIVGTHLYGISCDTAAMKEVADEHSLRVLYDGAHSFGRHVPIFEDAPGALGDVTMLSFHATKLFHSVEGGALVTEDAELDRRFRLARNFGIKSEDEVEGIGFNGKMSEFHAAMGLMVLDLVDEEIDRRAVIARHYEARLAGTDGLEIVAGLGDSRQYLVVRVGPTFHQTREELHQRLRAANVMSRKYFYPLCSDLDAYSALPSAQDLPHAQRAATECLVLPLHGQMTIDHVDLICDIVGTRPRVAVS